MTTATDPSLGPGRVFGRYVLYDQIASGGMASVHFGRLMGPAGFARTVAIKKLHPQYASDPEFVSMFLDEARIASRINHPNVAATIDVVAAQGELLLVMEYVHGESLSRLMRALKELGRRIPPAIAVSIVIDTLYGLHAAHEAKSERGEPLSIVHRDVSPHNVMVGRDGIGRVLDFGIAKAASRLQTTEGGFIKGKLAYMAPEQLTFGNVDRRADIFAASIMLWEALTGERLFAGDDQGSIISRVLTGPIEPPSKYDPALPAALDAIVLRGLARTRIERFPTAHEMALALEGAIVPARASAVGSWVADVAAESLSVRGSRLGEIESSHVPSVGPAGHPETPAPLARAESGETAATIHVGGEAAVGAKRRFAVRGTWAALAALFVLAASFALTLRIVRGRARASSAPEVVAPSAPPMADAPVAAAAASNTDLDATNPPAVAGTAARPAGDLRRPAVKKARSNCSPPYSFDADGVKHFKPGCL